MLGVRRVSLAPCIPANHTSPLTSSPSSPSYPIWGEGSKVAEVEHTVPPPSPPSWAEMVRRGTTLPLGQPPSHTPPGPASRHPPPLSAHILQLCKDCVTRGIWAKLVFEKRGGGEEYSFFCSPQPGATAATTAAGRSHRQGRKKRPPNKRQRERARRRREAWIERRNCSSPSNNTAATATCTAAAGEKIPAAAATTVSENLSAAAATTACTAAAEEKIPAATTTVAENLSAAKISAAAVGLAAATTATTAATSVNITVAADVVIGTTTGVKAVATTAAALRERSKVWAGERRSSARASVFEQRRNSLVSASQESPEKLRGAEDLNESFRIQFEEGDMQREELICSSCLSTHHHINNPLCIFCGWKVLE